MKSPEQSRLIESTTSMTSRDLAKQDMIVLVYVCDLDDEELF